MKMEDIKRECDDAIDSIISEIIMTISDAPPEYIKELFDFTLHKSGQHITFDLKGTVGTNNKLGASIIMSEMELLAYRMPLARVIQTNFSPAIKDIVLANYYLDKIEQWKEENTYSSILKRKFYNSSRDTACKEIGAMSHLKDDVNRW